MNGLSTWIMSTTRPAHPARTASSIASGTHIFNLISMLTSRDNGRQGEVDLSVLAVTIADHRHQRRRSSGPGCVDDQVCRHLLGCDPGNGIHRGRADGHSSFLSVARGGLARALEALLLLVPSIRAGLAVLGVLPGTADYEFFFTVFQTVIDSMDPINWAAEAARLQ